MIQLLTLNEPETAGQVFKNLNISQVMKFQYLARAASSSSSSYLQVGCGQHVVFSKTQFIRGKHSECILCHGSPDVTIILQAICIPEQTKMQQEEP
jgi:hypothetical protein